MKGPFRKRLGGKRVGSINGVSVVKAVLTTFRTHGDIPLVGKKPRKSK